VAIVCCISNSLPFLSFILIFSILGFFSFVLGGFFSALDLSSSIFSFSTGSPF
jgi:hypothetical protein